MNTQSSAIVQRLRNYCDVLRDDRIPYGCYICTHRLAAGPHASRAGVEGGVTLAATVKGLTLELIFRAFQPRIFRQIRQVWFPLF